MKAVFIEWYLPNIPFISTIDLVKLWESKYLLHTSRIYEFYSLWICLIILDSGPVECPPQFQGHLVIPFNSIEALVSSLQFYGHTVLMFFVFFDIWIIFDIILSCCWWHFIHQGCWSGEFYKPTILQTQTGLIPGVPPVIPMCFPRTAWVCILGNVPSSIAQNHSVFKKCSKTDTSTSNPFYKRNQPNQSASPFYQDWHCQSEILFWFGAWVWQEHFIGTKDPIYPMAKRINQGGCMMWDFRGVVVGTSCAIKDNQRKEGLWRHCCRAEMAGGGVNAVLAIDPWRTFGLWPGPSLCLC